MILSGRDSIRPNECLMIWNAILKKRSKIELVADRKIKRKSREKRKREKTREKRRRLNRKSAKLNRQRGKSKERKKRITARSKMLQMMPVMRRKLTNCAGRIVKRKKLTTKT